MVVSVNDTRHIKSQDIKFKLYVTSKKQIMIITWPVKLFYHRSDTASLLHSPCTFHFCWAFADTAEQCWGGAGC